MVSQKTASGIFIPEKAQEALNEGVVVAVGKGALSKEGKHIPVQVNTGDKVILPAFGGSPVKVQGEVSVDSNGERVRLINNFLLGIPLVP